MSSSKSGITDILSDVRQNLQKIIAELKKNPNCIDQKHPKIHKQLVHIINDTMPWCISQVAELEKRCNSHKEMLETEETGKCGIDHVRKIHGHKSKDEADPEKAATKYSQLFKSTFDPLYETLEGATLKLTEKESSFLVNRMFQITYTKCTELMITKMCEQLQKLFVQHRDLSNIEMERMIDTQYAFGLLLHAANIKEYKISDEIHKIMPILCESTLIKSAFGNMDREQLQSLIKQAMEIMQSFLILVPPMVVDCSPYPDLETGDYTGKKVTGCTSTDYTPTQSALFYSYKGESVSRLGNYVPIRDISDNVHAQFPPCMTLEGMFKYKPTFKALQGIQEDKELGQQHSEVSQDIKQQINVPAVQKEWKQQINQGQLKLELQPLITEMEEIKHGYQKAFQKSDEQHRQQLQESEEKYEKKLQETTHELHVLIEGVRHDNQKVLEITEKNKNQEITIEQLREDNCFFRSQWVIESMDVKMTQEVISRGEWGEVKVGVFRDTRVAVKVLNSPISSDHIFSNKMLIAFRLRHPNILQFIGATKVACPMILAEVMPISLHDKIHKKSGLIESQILPISRDIASALNYIHLWRPQPILHQDVSCLNVFLTPTDVHQLMGKLSNFGSANFQNQISPKEALCNPAYVAPECHYSDFSPAMDVYSFGILLMEMVTNHHPPETPHEKQDRIKTIQWKFMKQIIQSCIKEDKKERKHISTILVEIDQELRKQH